MSVPPEFPPDFSSNLPPDPPFEVNPDSEQGPSAEATAQDKARSLQQELEQSAWLQKFKWLSLLLNQIKAQFPLTQLCRLEWLTEKNILVIHCSSSEVWEGLIQQQLELLALPLEGNAIILRYEGREQRLQA